MINSQYFCNMTHFLGRQRYIKKSIMQFFLLFLHKFFYPCGQYIKQISYQLAATGYDIYKIDEMAYIKEERYDEQVTAEIAKHYKEILRLLGEDPEREGLLKTPERVAKALQFLTHGAHQDGAEILRSAMFNEEYQQMVLVKDIELYSTCEHHVMPFIGKAHVAYIPNGKITGLSKIARVVETFARRLQVQERLTTQIRDCIQNTLNPLGVAVVIEASHTCMTLRGVQKANAVTTTSAFSGIFLKDERTRNEFLNLIK